MKRRKLKKVVFSDYVFDNRSNDGANCGGACSYSKNYALHRKRHTDLDDDQWALGFRIVIVTECA